MSGHVPVLLSEVVKALAPRTGDPDVASVPHLVPRADF